MNQIKNPVNALFKHIIITLLISIIGLCIGNQIPDAILGVIAIVFMAFLVISIILVLFSKKSRNGKGRRSFSMWITYGYGLILGILSAPMIRYYLKDLGANIVLAVFIGTLLIVLALAIFSYKKGTDSILKLGPILFISTLSLIFISIILAFFANFTLAQIIISVVSIIVFSLWVIYDVYSFKKYAHTIETTRDLAPYVLDIYIDIINIFIDILRLVSIFTD